MRPRCGQDGNGCSTPDSGTVGWDRGPGSGAAAGAPASMLAVGGTGRRTTRPGPSLSHRINLFGHTAHPAAKAGGLRREFGHRSPRRPGRAPPSAPSPRHVASPGASGPVCAPRRLGATGARRHRPAMASPFRSGSPRRDRVWAAGPAHFCPAPRLNPGGFRARGSRQRREARYRRSPPGSVANGRAQAHERRARRWRRSPGASRP